MRQLSMPFQVGWDIVHECNLRCKHCYFDSHQLSDRRSFSKDEAVAFVRELGEKKVFHLSIAGGEPLLYPFLEDVIFEATKWGIVTALSTNAILLTNQRATSLWDAGLRSLQISLEGSCAEVNDSIRGKGSFEKTIAGMRTAIDHKFKVLVAVVILRQNADDIPQLFELASVEGATGVKVQTLIDSGLGLDNHGGISIPHSELIGIIENLWAIKKTWANRLKIMLPLVPGVIADAREAPEYYYQNASCLGCQPGLSTIRINNVGNVRACGAQVADDESVGNVLEKSLQSIWVESQEIARWRNTANLSSNLSPTSCGSICGKGCRASSAPAFAKTTFEIAD